MSIRGLSAFVVFGIAPSDPCSRKQPGEVVDRRTPPQGRANIFEPNRIDSTRVIRDPVIA
jgi:hypothetical protein